MILVIDNYDSFVHNVARYLVSLGEEVHVVRNDCVDLAGVVALAPTAIVISPGPCTPAEAGVSCEVIARLGPTMPILGVCLGHQCLGAVYGGRVVRARRPLHGQASDISHDGTGLFEGVAEPMRVGRYHSLIVEPTEAMTAHLKVDAVSEEGEVMALSHRRHPSFGVQFHPESVLSPQGMTIFKNFLVRARHWARDAVA